MKEIEWSVKHWNELSKEEFHEIARLRVDIFVVEQTCPYPELDGLDRSSIHVQGVWDGQLIAYARIIPPTKEDSFIHIGRVVTKKEERGNGLGHLVMSKAMMACLDLYPGSDVKLAAQSHLTDYYAKHGFKVIGAEYTWDGIPHRDMILKRKQQ